MIQLWKGTGFTTRINKKCLCCKGTSASCYIRGLLRLLRPTYTGQSVTSHFRLLHAIYKLNMQTFNQTSQHCSRQCHFQYSLHRHQKTSSTFEKNTHSCPNKYCSHSYAATYARHSVLPCHLHSGVLAGCLSNGQTDKNLMVWGQNFKVNATTLSIQILWWAQWCKNLWDKLNTGKNSDFLMSQYIG